MIGRHIREHRAEDLIAMDMLSIKELSQAIEGFTAPGPLIYRRCPILARHGDHSEWVAAARAGGTTSGEGMHKACHTAGQRVLDHTGNLKKALQKLLGHASIQTTGNIYADWTSSS
jgi:integrase